MTKEELIRMAREAGWPDSLVAPVIMDKLAEFAALVAAAEREACAAIAKDWDKDHQNTNYGGCISSAIRARGQG